MTKDRICSTIERNNENNNNAFSIAKDQKQGHPQSTKPEKSAKKASRRRNINQTVERRNVANNEDRQDTKESRERHKRKTKEGYIHPTAKELFKTRPKQKQNHGNEPQMKNQIEPSIKKKNEGSEKAPGPRYTQKGYLKKKKGKQRQTLNRRHKPKSRWRTEGGDQEPRENQQ